MYLIGLVMWAYNIYKTITVGKPLDKEPQTASPMAA